MKPKKRRGNSKFKPNSEFIAKAIDIFIANGGKITRIEFDKENFDPAIQGSLSEVDEFLAGV